MRKWLPVVVLAWLVAAAPADAKKFRYASGPQPGADTTLAVAQQQYEPVVRARGPKVPFTNLQLTRMAANVAFDRALARAPLESGTRVVLAPSASHPLNFAVEHAVLMHLGRRGVTATVRRSLIPDDSLSVAGGAPGDPVLDYQLATARITYLRLRGWLPGRVKIERQALVEGGITLRDPATATVLWTGDASYNLVDAFPRGQLGEVEDERFSDLKAPVPGRTVDKVVEPVIVVAVVFGLVALFFQNRP
jgi:hypothetical protein